MAVYCYQINDALQFIPVASKETLTACQKSDVRTWLDLQDVEPGALEAWLDNLSVQGLCRRLCLEARERPGFYPFNKEIFFTIPVLDEEEVPAVDHLAFLCRDNLLLTLHRKPIIDSNDLDEAETWLLE